MMRTKSEELSQFKSLTLELVELSKIEDLSAESKNVIKDLTIALKYQIEYSIMNEILKESESVKELIPTIDEIIKPYLITVCPVLFHIKNSALALDVNDNVSVFALFTIIFCLIHNVPCLSFKRIGRAS